MSEEIRELNHGFQDSWYDDNTTDSYSNLPKKDKVNISVKRGGSIIRTEEQKKKYYKAWMKMNDKV